MVETYVGPSELHLKKELTALGKYRLLRDPDTDMSWKSPLSSTSFGTTSNFNAGNENAENKEGMNYLSGSFELPSGYEKRRRKVCLYNWGHHSSKSSDSGFQLDEGKNQTSVKDSPQEIMNDVLKLDSRNDAYLNDPVNSISIRGKNPEISVRKIARKSSRGVTLRRRNKKNSSVTKMLDLASNSLEALKSSGQSDDSGYCSSEELPESKHKLSQKIGCCSQCASPPVFSRSACGNWSSSTKILKNARRDRSSFSCTLASNSSNNRCGSQILSTGRSWDRTSASFNGDEVDQLDYNSQICGIPCSLSKRAKEPCSRSCSSAALSDTPSRMVRSILCGSCTVHSKRRSSNSHKHKYTPKSSQGMPLLTNSFDGVDSSADTATDELATNFGELDLEAVNRLDGRRWSNCRSHEGPELEPPEGFNSHMAEEKCLSQKYRPRSFDEIVGQKIVVQSLNSAILTGRIAPAYLFQGPRGTGKTSIARIFAAALNCLSKGENGPCGLCSECSNFASGIGLDMKEVDATNKKDIGKIRLLLKRMATGTTFSRYKVFVIDECHMLSSKSWTAFMKFLEEPLSRVVFIFITIDPSSLPCAVVSRCQKYLFPKIKDVDIAFRLRKLSAEENLDVEWDAIDLIASNSDGSICDAETMLDQLSLLGKKITTALVNDLLGVVSDEKLLELLEIALSSDTAETVKRSRELMESGADPVTLMSQLAGLIMDIIAGTYRLPKSRSSSTVLLGQSLIEAEMERLQQALKILSDAEKQLRLSSQRSTWFTAALLELGASHSPQPTPSRSSSRQSIKRLDDGGSEKTRESSSSENKSNPSLSIWESNSASIPGVTSGRISISAPRSLLDITQKEDATSVMVPRCVSPDKLDAIWRWCVEKCDSERLKHMLYAHGKLVSITETKGVLIAYIVFGDGNIKSRAESFLRSIKDSIAIVLKHSVEVRIGLVPENYLKALKSLPGSPSRKNSEIEYLEKVGESEPDRKHESSNMPRSVDYSENKLRRTEEALNIPVQRESKAAIDEQRLESAWLKAAENGEAPLVSQSKEFEQEKNHQMPQNGTNNQNQIKSLPDISMSFKHWGDEQNDEIEEVETNHSQSYHKEQAGLRVERYHHAISPSLLHSNSFRANFDQESLGYESGPVQCGLCCWKTHKSNREEVKRGNHVRSQRAGGWFGKC